MPPIILKDFAGKDSSRKPVVHATGLYPENIDLFQGKIPETSLPPPPLSINPLCQSRKSSSPPFLLLLLPQSYFLLLLLPQSYFLQLSSAKHLSLLQPVEK